MTQEESVKADLSIPNQIVRGKEIAALRNLDHWQIYVEPKHVTGEYWIERCPALNDLVRDIRAGKVTAVAPATPIASGALGYPLVEAMWADARGRRTLHRRHRRAGAGA